MNWEQRHIWCKKGVNKEGAGMYWFRSFTERCLELSLRKSLRQGMNGKFLMYSRNRYSIINKFGNVVATEGSKCIHNPASKENRQSAFPFVCVNAEGTFLPPVLIMKGVKKFYYKSEGLHPDSDFYMKKKAYTNAELFLKWIKEVCIPRKKSC